MTNLNNHDSLNPSVQKYYKIFNEKERLNYCCLERDRTLYILKKMLSPSHSVIFDIGGAAGAYAFPLTKMGHEVHLIDPVDRHLLQAKKHAKTCGYDLANYIIGDARKIEKTDNSADAILLLGPLYHLKKQNDRIKALQEAYRVLKPKGLIFAAGISRFSSFMKSMYLGIAPYNSNKHKYILKTGVANKKANPLMYFHLPMELRKEVEMVGFKKVSIKAIEGPVWDHQIVNAIRQDKKGWNKLLNFLDSIEHEEAIIGASGHFMAVGSK